MITLDMFSITGTTKTTDSLVSSVSKFSGFNVIELSSIEVLTSSEFVVSIETIGTSIGSTGPDGKMH